jgi:hypothetical protein
VTAQSSAVNVAGTGGVAVTGACTYRGFSISSVAGADVVIYDNTSGSGLVLAAFTLGAKGWSADDVSDGLRCLNGIFLTATAAITGHVRIG